MADFYPILIKTLPPRIVTRADTDAYFTARGTVVLRTDIPATSPVRESDVRPEEFAKSLRVRHIRREVLR